MDKIKESTAISVVKKIFLIFIILICIYFIIGQILVVEDRKERPSTYTTFSDGWIWVKADGSREPIEMPGKCEADRNELIKIENTLPNNVKDNLYLFIRSSKQEMKVYIDGVLRQEYTTKDIRWFGKVSAVAWVLVGLDEEDAGKNITIELQSDSSYSGVFHDIHYGTKWDIYRTFFKENGVELIIGLVMFFIGIASVIISFALKIIYKKNMEMEYLAWEVVLTAIWILSNSVFRQVLFPSISTISDMAFFMVMLIAIPVMLYLNAIQNERYWKAYFVAIVVNLVNAIVCTVLHVFNLVDFSDTIKLMGIVDVLSIVLVAYTLIRDLVTGKIREYKLIAGGICVICGAGIVQLVIYFKWTNQFSGSVMAIAMVIVLLFSFINTITDILSIEKEKQRAIVSNEAKGKFLANMSHEIRTPINSVLGMNTMILRECEDEVIREYAMNIQNAGQTLLALINDILDFSKIESGKMEIVPVDYEFSSMIHDVITMIMMRAEEKGLVINLSVDNNIPYLLHGDEVRIRQILTNLLTNALKYTKEGSISLNIKARKDGECVCLYYEVADTGIGIKPEDIEKLFTRFERIEEERNRNIEGTGLGMSITMQLLKLMDSELQVESEYGKGSRFSFELKQKIVSEEPIGDLENNIKSNIVKYKYDIPYTAENAHILVVDDNMMNRKVFIGLMKSTKIQIDEAESGMECLERIKNKHYDIIFLDHMMPKMSGIQTLENMKADIDHKCIDTPVIALTANAIMGAREMYMEAGFNDFLSKPVNPDKLDKMVEKWLPEELLVYENPNETAIEVLPEEKLDLPLIEGIDWNSAMERIPDIDVLMETVTNFYYSMNAEADYLEDCYKNLDKEEYMDSYRIKVHSMKSSAALIGANTLSNKAKELEFAARDKKKYILEEETEGFLTEWRSYKEKLSVLVKEDKTEIEDTTVLLKLFDELKEALEDMDIDKADEVMKLLRSFNYSDEMEVRINDLSSAVIDLDAELAGKYIDEITEKLK